MSLEPSDAEPSTKRHGGRYIYEELRRQIQTLKLKPGAPLDEVSLAAQFGLSRSPVRDALARLLTEGLVTMLPNRTVLVTPFEIEDFPKYVAALDLVQRAVTRLAAMLRSDDELQRIRDADEAYMAAITQGDFQAMTELNKTLHLEISRAGKNPYLTHQYARLLGEGQRLLHLQFDFMASNLAEHKLGRDHDAIIDAIARGDAQAAEDAAHEHTLVFQRRFLDFLQQNLTAGVSVRV